MAIYTIGIFYLVGLVTAFIGGIYAGFYGEKHGLTSDEIMECNIKAARIISLEDLRVDASKPKKVLLDIIEWILFPILTAVHTLMYLSYMGKLVDAKNQNGSS